MTIIKPTVGRVILVERGSFGTEIAPCLVTKVWGDRCVNAAGFNTGGTAVSFSSLVVVQEGDEVPPVGPYARWMDYQLGQAAKTEAAETALAAAPPASP